LCFSSIAAIQLLTSTNDIVTGLWNTVAGGDSTPSSPGNCSGCFWPNEYPERAFDDILITRYINYGVCHADLFRLDCGEKTGLHSILRRGPSLLVYMIIRTGGTQPERDPLTITIEGSNARPSSLFLGSSWTLIYSGSSGLLVDPGRTQFGQQINMAGNTVWYSSYRILVITKRGVHSAVQFGEIELYGY